MVRVIYFHTCKMALLYSYNGGKRERVNLSQVELLYKAKEILKATPDVDHFVGGITT